MNVPKLRFKEFDGKVQYEKTERFFKHIRNGFVGTATPYYTDSSGIKYLQSNNIKDGQINEKNIVYINEEFHKKHEKNTLKIGDLLVVQSGHAGDCAVVNEKYINCNCHALIIMTPNSQDEINTEFLNVYMHTSKGKKELNKLITGNTIKHILASDMKKFNFPNLQIEEQKKIAAFFKILDKKIQLQQQKIDLLQEQKKGFLQKMFPKAGETQPKIRFKGFKNDWETIKAKDLFNPVVEKNRQELPVLSVTQDNGVVYRNDVGIDIKYDPNTLNNYKVIHPGDFVISLRSFQGGFELSNKLGICSPAYTIFVPKVTDKHDNSFWKTKFKTFNFIESLKTVTFGIRDGKSISFSEFGDLKLSFPNVQEQQKIGSFFEELDKRISMERKKLKKLQQQKQGFMQQMFI